MNISTTIKRAAKGAMLLAASLLAASPALADSYTTVKIYHTTSKPVTVIHSIDGLYHVYTRPGKAHGYSGHRHHNRDKYRIYSRHDVYRGHALWARPSQSYYGYSAPARGSWSSDRHREKVKYNRNGRDSKSYRRTERHSVTIRQRSR